MSNNIEGENEGKENSLLEMDAAFDELLGPANVPRVTPRTSIATQATPQSTKTPYANLRQLAGLIRRPSTPHRRASSVGTVNSQGRPTMKTSMSHPKTTPRVRRPLQVTAGNRSNPTTPHAVRAFRQRRGTPGFDRRKSGKMQRETPRDALRNLSKILAQTSQPIKPSPTAVQSPVDEIRNQAGDDFEDELNPQPPESTMLGSEGNSTENSSLLAPPRLSMPLEDGEQTARSVEIGRRVSNQEDLTRMSRNSAGLPRPSDLFHISENDASENLEKLGTIVDVGNDETARSDDRFQSPLFNVDNSEVDANQDYRLDSRSQLDFDSAMSPGLAASSPFVLQLPNIPLPEDSVPSLNEGGSEPNFEQFDVSEERHDLNSYDPVTKPSTIAPAKAIRKPRAPRIFKKSRYGNPYPSFPSALTRSIASRVARSMGFKSVRLNKEIVKALIEASDEFFGQLGNDLEIMSKHAGRKTIDESDVIAVMHRQRQVSLAATPFSLAAKYLPGELQKDVRTPVAKILQRRRRRILQDVPEEDEGDSI